MVRDDLYPEEDNCLQCEINQYLLTPVTIANKSTVCMNCPVGGYCPGIFCFDTRSVKDISQTLSAIKGGNVVIATSNYWRASDGDVAGVSSRRDSSSMQVSAAIYPCPPGNCVGYVLQPRLFSSRPPMSVPDCV